jgi:hypothetical protein
VEKFRQIDCARRFLFQLFLQDIFKPILASIYEVSEGFRLRIFLLSIWHEERSDEKTADILDSTPNLFVSVPMPRNLAIAEGLAEVLGAGRPLCQSPWFRKTQLDEIGKEL